MAERNDVTPDPIEALLDAAARASTGRLGVKEAQRRVRSEMLRQALEVSGGNRHAMARMLRVDRSYVLKMLREARRDARQTGA
jgi:DNA-binding NtrC family response regulator